MNDERKLQVVPDVAVEVEADFLKIQRREIAKPISTGLSELDAMLGGGWPETLCIIGAWPGVGKSAFIASMLQRMGKESVPVLLFSLEDAASWLVWRYLAYETGVAQVQLRQPGLSQEARRAAQQAFSDISQYGQSIWIDDRCPLSDKDIERSAKRA